MHEVWVDRDPLRRMQRHLVARGIVDSDGLERIEEEVKEELRVAWDEAQAEPAPDPLFYFGQAYASPSPRLDAQLARFSRRRDA